ncbi:unnamed protein product, partial [Staurois parvus]
QTDNSWGPWVIGDHGAPVSSPTPKKAYEKANERYQGHLIGPPTDPRPLGSARVLEWSVRPWYIPYLWTLSRIWKSLYVCFGFHLCLCERGNLPIFHFEWHPNAL